MSIDTLATWVQSVIGSSTTVVIAPNNAPLSAGECLVIQEMTSRSNEYPYEELGEGDTEGDVLIHMDVTETNTYQFDVYAESGKATLRQVIAAAHTPACPVGIVLNEWSDIRDLSFIEDSGYAFRWQADSDFSFAHRDTFEDDAVLTIHATGDFAGIDSATGEPLPEEPTP